LRLLAAHAAGISRGGMSRKQRLREVLLVYVRACCRCGPDVHTCEPGAGALFAEVLHMHDWEDHFEGRGGLHLVVGDAWLPCLHVHALEQWWRPVLERVQDCLEVAFPDADHDMTALLAQVGGVEVAVRAAPAPGRALRAAWATLIKIGREMARAGAGPGGLAEEHTEEELLELGLETADTPDAATLGVGSLAPSGVERELPREAGRFRESSNFCFHAPPTHTQHRRPAVASTSSSDSEDSDGSTGMWDDRWCCEAQGFDDAVFADL
jgi:hypothetical protein